MAQGLPRHAKRLDSANAATGVGAKGVVDNRGGFRENNPQWLTPEETSRIIECFTSGVYRDLPLNIAHTMLMDQGIYVASLSTCKRVMKAYYQSIGKAVNRVVERRKRPEYSATGPNQVWCWDTTWLHSEVTGKYYYLYLIIDMYSRYIVDWVVHTKEDGELAEHLFAETIQKHCPGQNVSLLVHADNGKPMRSRDLKSLFEKLHVMSSHSRPHTSNDNAFAESIFLTMKSRIVYPECFVSIEDAERFVIEFVDWYNNEHLHSGLDLLPPCAVHFGYHQELLDRRNVLLEKAANFIPSVLEEREKSLKSMNLYV